MSINIHMRKCVRNKLDVPVCDHSTVAECICLPVRHHLYVEASEAQAKDALVFLFLMMCASSKIMR